MLAAGRADNYANTGTLVFGCVYAVQLQLQQKRT